MLYGGALDKCGVCFGHLNMCILPGKSTFADMSGMSDDQISGNVLSDPFRVCMCHELQPNCTVTTVTRKVYPG